MVLEGIQAASCARCCVPCAHLCPTVYDRWPPSTAALQGVLQCGKEDWKQEYSLRNNMKVNGRVLKDSLELR